MCPSARRMSGGHGYLSRRMPTMTGDVHGPQGDPPFPGLTSVPAPRREVDFVAPLTVGAPRWQRRYADAGLAVDAVALASVPVFFLLWRNALSAPLVAVALSAGGLAL